MLLRALLIIFLLCSVLALSPNRADALPPGFSTETVVSGLGNPTDVEFASANLAFVAEFGGRIRTIWNGNLQSQPFVNISPAVNVAGNRGLLGIAVHPDFPATPYVYAAYSYDPPETANAPGTAARDSAGQRVARLSRFTADAASSFRTAVPNSEVVLAGTNSTWANIADPSATQDNITTGWTCYQNGTPFGTPVRDCLPADGLSHSMGAIEFGPDGMLYFANGDAASYNVVDPRAMRSQDLDSLTGKIMRIDPITGEGLADNPFFDGDVNSNRSKVYNYGLRNPYRFSIDQSGELWIGDVGWTEWEEMNVGAGKDFGWPCYEGAEGASLATGGYSALPECVSYYASATATAPAVAWNHNGGTSAALAGPTYSGDAYPAEYEGARFYADYANGWVRTEKNGVTSAFTTGIVAMVDMELGPDGNLYFLEFLSGNLKRVVNNDAPPAFNCSVTANANGSVTVGWNGLGGSGFDVIEDGAPAYWVTSTSIVDTTPAASYEIKAWGLGSPFNGLSTTCSNDVGTNTAPELAPLADRTDPANEAVTFTASATDANGDDLTFSAEGLPPGIQLRPRAGEFAGTPTQPGTYPVTVTVRDGRGGTDSASFTWSIGTVSFACSVSGGGLAAVTVSWTDMNALGYDIIEDGAAPYWRSATTIADNSPASTYTIRAWGLPGALNGISTSCANDVVGEGFTCTVVANPNGTTTVSWADLDGLGYDVIEDGAAPYWTTGSTIVDASPAATYRIVAWGLPAPNNGISAICSSEILL